MSCYERCATEFNTSSLEISKAFAQARASLTANKQLIRLIKELRASRPDLRVYAMSNIAVRHHVVEPVILP
jgi:hypothetical protein